MEELAFWAVSVHAPNTLLADTASMMNGKGKEGILKFWGDCGLSMKLGNKVASSDLSLAATVAHWCMENGYGRVASSVDVLMAFLSVYLNKDKTVVRRYITEGKYACS